MMRFEPAPANVCAIAWRAMQKRDVVACMGGWCKSRLSCSRYVMGDTETFVDRISERLCPRGVEIVGGPVDIANAEGLG